MKPARPRSSGSAASSIPTFSIAHFGASVRSVDFDFARLCHRLALLPYPHRHDFYQIVWITRGRGRHVIDGVPYAVRPNTVFFMSPRQVHEFELPADADGYVMNFSEAFFVLTLQNKELLHEIPFYRLRHSTPVVHASAEQASQLARIVELIEDEYGAEQPGFADVIRSYLHVFLMQAGRLVDPRARSVVSSRAFLLTRQFKALAEQHPATLRSAKAYAQALKVTERRLNEATKQATGSTANALIRERLLLEAKRLLVHTDTPVARIATMLQFQDPAYFTRFFRQHAGIAPLEFRRSFARKVTTA
jgi:AraC family transcriptional activator of pobA